MTTLELPLSEDALIDLRFYAKEKGMTVADMVMEAIRQKLEDLEDIREAERALAKIACGEETISWEEAKKELGL